jgi:acetyl esterase/lipase
MLDHLAVAMVALLSGTPTVSERPSIMTAGDAMKLPRPAADRRLSYGSDPLQFGELRIPDSPGPHPVAIVIHGGCWLSEYGLGYISALAEALTDAGVATWSIEYRRVGDEGGGWPGTFTDVAAAADFLRTMAGQHRLDPERVVAIGHSAGGHLALWLAARSGLDENDGLRGAAPVELAGAVALAGIADLAAYASPTGCGSAVAGLLGGEPDQVPERVRRGSPMSMLPLGVPAVMITGELDTIVPGEQAESFAAAARGVGDRVAIREVEGAGHFELVDPEHEAFRTVLEAVQELLDVQR